MTGALVIGVQTFALPISREVPVINVSLVGPPNLLVRTAVTAVQRRGLIVGAAVGNDGPAAAPLYPAAYPGVVAVTGVDSNNRVLIEAGRGPDRKSVV